MGQNEHMGPGIACCAACCMHHFAGDSRPDAAGFKSSCHVTGSKRAVAGMPGHCWQAQSQPGALQMFVRPAQNQGALGAGMQ